MDAIIQQIILRIQNKVLDAGFSFVYRTKEDIYSSFKHGMVESYYIFSSQNIKPYADIGFSYYSYNKPEGIPYDELESIYKSIYIHISIFSYHSSNNLEFDFCYCEAGNIDANFNENFEKIKNSIGLLLKDPVSFEKECRKKFFLNMIGNMNKRDEDVQLMLEEAKISNEIDKKNKQKKQLYKSIISRDKLFFYYPVSIFFLYFASNIAIDIITMMFFR
jgi:hypothetical protein